MGALTTISVIIYKWGAEKRLSYALHMTLLIPVHVSEDCGVGMRILEVLADLVHLDLLQALPARALHLPGVEVLQRLAEDTHSLLCSQHCRKNTEHRLFSFLFLKKKKERK